ncbi:MAG: NAD-dependent epimerase/dehydratase family protein [Mucilaginibacter sp.]
MGTIKTVLLTGATGYLGSKLIDRLLEGGFKVCVIKRENSNLVRIKHYLKEIKCYNNDETGIQAAFSQNGIDLVIHCATLYGRKGETFLEIKNANLDFPTLVLDCAVKYRVKYFINTGTSLPVFANMYALFKSQFAKYLEFLSNSITSINIVLEHFYGPGDDGSKFITGMIKRIATNEPVIDLTAGTQLRDFIYIDDVLSAYIKLIEKLDSFGGYNDVPVGSGEVITIRHVVELIKHYTESKSLLNFGAVAMRENELMRSDADITKLKLLDWYPKYSFNEALELTIKSTIANN